MNKKKRAAIAFCKPTLTMLVLLTLIACSNINHDNYNKLESGMSKEEVIVILGQPEQCEHAFSFETCRWGDDDKNIEARFAADNLLAKTAAGL